MTQIARIERMEKDLNEALAAVKTLQKALDGYEAAKAAIDRLTAYYESPLWMKDFEDDAAGKLPADLRRGVLSEDAVYDLLSDHASLMERIAGLKGRA